MFSNSRTRRGFLKDTVAAGSLLVLGAPVMNACSEFSKKTVSPDVDVYRSINGNPAENMIRVIDLMGGISSIAGLDDVVVIKPNVQWWNQGAPNLLALKTFVDLVLDRPGAAGAEVVIAENCHRGAAPWGSESSGWARRFDRNSDLPGIHNYNDLCAMLKERYGDRFSTCHWINVASGASRVYSPAEGPGYIYCDGTGGVPLISRDNGAPGDKYRATIMTYPVFLTDKGTMVDLKDGVWEKSGYTDRPVRFINFAAVNHHSHYCGMTSAVKNYLGVSDLSGGANPNDGGKLTENYYNFHSFPFDEWASGPVPGMLGAQIATYLKTIRRADLNIATAEWVGLGSRTEPPVAHTRAVLASKDPVALDYHSAKYILHPNSRITAHSPDDPEGPLGQYLKACSEHGGGIYDETRVKIVSHDFSTGRLQGDDELVLAGFKAWGTDFKTLLKYAVFRFVNPSW